MLQYAFMVNAFAATFIVAVVAGSVGYFLVMRGQAFAAHAMSHVGFAGATGAVLIGLTPFVGLTIFTLLAGLGIGLMGDRAQSRDVAIGMVLALSLGLGLLFLHFYTSFAGQATALLFGNVLGVARDTVWAMLVLGICALVILAVIARPLAFASLQPELADARGIAPKTVGTVFMLLVALAVSESVQVVGILLVFTLMIAPPAAAMRLTSHMSTGIALSISFALAQAWFGLILAYYTGWPTTFWITLLGAAVFIVSSAIVHLKSNLF
ncbi:metal ABC transporter permease [Roseibium sp. RKSG952]|nr:metal ABC transporter permease [Roseibium sp. RKSG952]